jgi:hypothetical protein
MDDADDRAYVRAPTLEDLVRICAALNARGARYVLIGGFAVITHGAVRTTKDIDLLVDTSPENVERIKLALSILEDNAAAEIADSDLADYTVVRVADEVLIDLMGRACGVTYQDAIGDVETVTVQGVPIRLASKRTLLLTKRTIRPADQIDRRFLEELLAEEDNGLES